MNYQGLNNSGSPEYTWQVRVRSEARAGSRPGLITAARANSYDCRLAIRLSASFLCWANQNRFSANSSIPAAAR